MKCEKCHYFVRINESGGGCHESPPVPIFVPSQPDIVACYWPWVSNDDWCGKYKMKVVLN